MMKLSEMTEAELYSLLNTIEQRKVWSIWIEFGIPRMVESKYLQGFVKKTNTRDEIITYDAILTDGTHPNSHPQTKSISLLFSTEETALAELISHVKALQKVLKGNLRSAEREYDGLDKLKGSE